MSESGAKVVAVSKIARGNRSRCFSLLELNEVRETPNFPIEILMMPSGEIQPVHSALLPKFWPKFTKLAPDCHSQNVRLVKVSMTEVILQVVKDIYPRDELLLWFGDEILMDEMKVPPYLAPSNIRGEDFYLCNACGRDFEAPNILKVHLALQCHSLPEEVLWDRLKISSKVYQSKLQNSSSHTTNNPLFFPYIAAGPKFLSPTHQSLLPRLLIQPQQPLVVSTSLPLVSTATAVAATSSAKSTISKHQQTGLIVRHEEPVGVVRENSSLANKKSTPNAMTMKTCSSENKTVSISDPHAQLESIVSNMGKGRNGHLCLYCGKLYSRKYGLKIHIRTHTGYKPLSCKICHRPFGDPSNLNKHIRLHSDGNTPYRCDICNKVLVRKRDLERHIKSRHNGVPDGIVLDCTMNNNNISSSTPSSTESITD